MKIKIRKKKFDNVVSNESFSDEFPIRFLKYILFMRVILFIFILNFLKYH